MLSPSTYLLALDHIPRESSLTRRTTRNTPSLPLRQRVPTTATATAPTRLGLMSEPASQPAISLFKMVHCGVIIYSGHPSLPSEAESVPKGGMGRGGKRLKTTGGDKRNKTRPPMRTVACPIQAPSLVS